jgi:hypothetical protein
MEGRTVFAALVSTSQSLALGRGMRKSTSRAQGLKMTPQTFLEYRLHVSEHK